MKITRIAFVSLATVFLIGCQETTDPPDPGISLSQPNDQQIAIDLEIKRLFRLRGPRNAALRIFRNIHRSLDKGQIATAQNQGVQLCRLAGEQSLNGFITGGTPDSRTLEAQALCVLVLVLVGTGETDSDRQILAGVLVNLPEDAAAGVTVANNFNCAATRVFRPAGNSGIDIPAAQCLEPIATSPPPSGAAGSQDFAPPPPSGTGSVLFTISDCTADIDVDIPVVPGTCHDIQALTPVGTRIQFTGADPATLAMCDLVATPPGGVITTAQEELIRVHQQDGANVKALPFGVFDLCGGSSPSIGSTGSNGLVRFARGLVNSVRDRVVGLVAPKPLLARAYSRMYRRHRCCPPIDGGISQFQWALPAEMTPLPGSDGQTAGPGTSVPVPPGVHVTDALGGDVSGATVTFTVTLGGGTVTPVSSVTTGTNGIAQLTSWELGPAPTVPVTNTLEASGKGIADPDDPGPFVPVTPLFDAVTLETGVVVFTATSEKRILIYGLSLVPSTTFRPDNEQTFAEAEGFTVTVKDATAWGNLKTAEFASFNAIVIGDGGGLAVLGAAETNRAVWSAAITGPVVISTLNPAIHQCDLVESNCRATFPQPTGTIVHQPEAVTLIRNAINFAAGGAGTGAYISLGARFDLAPENTDVVLLSQIGDFEVAGIAVVNPSPLPNFFFLFSDIIEIFAPSNAVMAGLAVDGSGLSGWSASNHEFIQVFPTPSYTVLARSERTPVGGATVTMAVIIACSPDETTDCVVPPAGPPPGAAASFDVTAGPSSNVSEVKLPKNIR